MDTSTSNELRIFTGVVAVVFGTGLAGALFPAAETTIIATVVVLAVVGFVARILWWRLREYRADHADAIAATAARAAYIARPAAQAQTGAVHRGGGRGGVVRDSADVRVVA